MEQYNIDDLINYLKSNKVLEQSIQNHIIKLNHQATIEQLIKTKKRVYGNIQWRSICAVLSVEKYHEYYKSILIDCFGNVFSSTKSSKQLINEFMNSLGMKYEEFVEKTANRQYKVPYVYKHFIILPDAGVTSRQVNWLFLNHLVGFDKQIKTDDTILYFKHIEIYSAINIDFFIKQLKFITSIYDKQLNMLKEWQITDNIENSYLYQKTIKEYGPKTEKAENFLYW